MTGAQFIVEISDAGGQDPEELYRALQDLYEDLQEVPGISVGEVRRGPGVPGTRSAGDVLLWSLAVGAVGLYGGRMLVGLLKDGITTFELDRYLVDRISRLHPKLGEVLGAWLAGHPRPHLSFTVPRSPLPAAGGPDEAADRPAAEADRAADAGDPPDGPVRPESDPTADA